jgi:phosphate:Na+ symporter
MSPISKSLVKLLQAKIKDKTRDAALPQFLNDAALSYPQAALQVTLKETKHLFDLCFEAIAHGLGLSRTSMLSKEEMKNIAKEGGIEYSDTNIDDIYYHRIKNLYGEIIKFGTRAQGRYAEPKYVTALNGIMDANRYFVEIVKDVKDLQPNVLKYCNSDNIIMRNEYNKLRKRIAKFIRLVFDYQDFKIPTPLNSRETHRILDKINKERATLDEYVEKSKSKDVLYNGSLSKLIQGKELDSTMVTSLINDNRIANSISKHLIKAAELLYLNSDVILADQTEDEEESVSTYMQPDI